jgi:hypothetical protein
MLQYKRLQRAVCICIAGFRLRSCGRLWVLSKVGKEDRGYCYFLLFDVILVLFTFSILLLLVPSTTFKFVDYRPLVYLPWLLICECLFRSIFYVDNH